MLNVVEFLKMVGAPIAQVVIENHGGHVVSKANAFLAARGNWGSLLNRKQANVDTRQRRVTGTQDRIDEFICDLWQYQPNDLRTDDQYYKYLMTSYGWTRPMAEDKLRKAWAKWGRKYQQSAHQPGRAFKPRLAPGRHV